MSDEKNAVLEAVKRLESAQSAHQTNLEKFQKDVEAQINEIEQKGKASETLGSELTEQKEKLESQRLEIEKLRAQFNGSVKADPVLDFKTAGDRIQDGFDEFKERWKAYQVSKVKGPFNYRMQLEGFFPTGDEWKTTITSATVGSSTPGILTPERVVPYVPAARRRFTIRDLLAARPTGANTVEFPKENVFTNAASPQVEASNKAESALTFTIASEAVQTIAHWIPVAKQVLDDWTALGRIIDSTMMYGLKLKEEDEILNGSGAGVHLNGLVTQATSYAGTYAVVQDTNLDTLGWAFNELDAADEEGSDFGVIHPDNWWKILHIKDQASNVGNYVVGDPLGGGLIRGVTLWGKNIIVTNSMASGSFLVGNSNQAEVFDRQEAEVLISTEHSDYFIKNLVAILVEERLALAVYRPGAFRYGTF